MARSPDKDALAAAPHLQGPPSAARALDERTRILRFLVVGVVNTGLCYGVYLLLLWLGLHYRLALAADYVFGIGFGYLVNRSATFAARHLGHTAFVRYCATYGVVFLLNLALLSLLVERAGLSEAVGQIPALAVATMLSYVLQRWWVFRSARR